MKLQKKVIEGSKTTVTDYLDGYQYVDGVLEFYPHAEGYVNMKSGIPEYVYNYTDHLGNVRVSYVNEGGKAKIVEESNYYPFGLKHKGYNNVVDPIAEKYKYGYQGQESQDELGLNVIEFKYRFHDPAIGRFWQIDPLAEQYNYNSTYAFAENKLGLGIELEGLEVVPSYGMEYSNARTSEDYRRIQQAKNWQAAGAVAGAMFWGGAVAVAEVGWSGVASFVANEAKDEVLSQATGGASDVLDIGKTLKNVAEYGLKKIAEKSVKNIDEGVEFTADLSKTKSKTRSGHRNAGNKQLNEAMQNDPDLREKMESLDPNVLENTSLSIKEGNKTKTRKNPQGYEWDHNTNDPHKLDLRSKANHAEKTSKDPGRVGGFSKYYKE